MVFKIRVIGIAFFWLTAAMTYASFSLADSYQCRLKDGKMLYGDQPCPSGSTTVNHTVEASFSSPAKTSNKVDESSAERLSVNFNKTDTRRVIATFGEFTGITFHMNDLVAGSTTLVARDKPWDEILLRVLDQGNLRLLKTKKNNFYIYPSSMTPSVAEMWASRDGV